MTISFSVTNPNKNWHLGIAEYRNFEQAKSFLNKIGYQYGSEKSSIKYTAVGNGVLVCMIAGKWTDGKTTIHECTESELLQLEIGSEATTYEPYRTPQILTLQTPNGLPGVPVSKDGNYTDADGQQWICDEIDLGRGKYIERTWKKTLDGSELWGVYLTTGYEGFSTKIMPFNSYRRNGFCDLFTVKEVSDFEESVWFGVNNSNIYVIKSRFYDPSLEDKGLANWKAFLAENPMTVMTYMDTPIERDLTPEEIAAYKALRTYSPTTVITNDAGAGMEATYVADTKAYIDKKFKELNQAIVNTQIALL